MQVLRDLRAEDACVGVIDLSRNFGKETALTADGMRRGVRLPIAAYAFFCAIWIIAKTLLWGDPVPGYPTLIVVALFLGGMQLTFLGVIGEYRRRMFDETKRLPLYFTRRLDLPAPAIVAAATRGSASGIGPERLISEVSPQLHPNG